MNIQQIATLLQASVHAPAHMDPESITISKLAPIDRASEGEITFLANSDYAKFALTTKASAIITKQLLQTDHLVQLLHPEPYACFAKLAQHFFKAPQPTPGISSAAHIAKTAVIGKDVNIAAGVHIGERVKIGERVQLFPNVVIGDGTTIGEGSVLYPNVTVYHDCVIGKNVILHAGVVIGSDGFGYAVTATETIKIPQVGNVVIEDDVEIGATSTVDRAAMGSTRVGRGTKLDSRVQIAHNCVVGERCMISAFSGLAGSAKIGDRVTMGGHSGINGHVTITSDTTIGAMTGVISSIDESGDYVGFPAVPASQWRRNQVRFRRLEETEKRLRALEKALADKLSSSD